MQKVTSYLDPVYKEGLIIELGDNHSIPIHPYKDSERNLKIANVCEKALQAYFNLRQAGKT
jgi:hypothetical protein